MPHVTISPGSIQRHHKPKCSSVSGLTVLTGPLLGLLLPYHIEIKDHWTDLLVSPALNVDVIWASVACLLTRHFWSLRTRAIHDGQQFRQVHTWHRRSGDVKCPKMSEIEWVLSIWHPLSWVIRTILIHVTLLWVVDLVFTPTDHMLKYNCYRSGHFHSNVQQPHLHYIYLLPPHDFWNITECMNRRHLSINVIGKFLVFNPRQHSSSN